MQVKKMWSSGLVVGLLFTALIGGCAKGDKGDISTSVDNPSAATFRPVGTIQGKVRDASTLEPIVNAIVSIGLAADVTDAQGQYILANVPATSDALNNTVNGRYDMTVDLRAAISNGAVPVDMRVAGGVRYPDFRYENVSVDFTSLNDSTPCPDTPNADNDGLNSCGTNNTNHDTPVDGLVANADVNVGKLNSNIQGVVAGCSGTADFLVPVPAGYTVNLITNSTDNQNTGTGQPGNVVGTTTTDASGSFSFSNIEASQGFTITAVDVATNPTLEGSVSVTSPSDGLTLFLRVQESTAVHVCSVDNHGPSIIAVSPEPGSDQTAGATTVTFTFSEPVEQTPGTDVTQSGVDNLFDMIEVNFDGNKAGNLPYTLVWNATFDQLTVGITTGASALYHVRILNIDAIFHDAAGQLANMGVCQDDSNIPAGYGVGASGGPDDCSVWFSTNGGTVVTAAPVLTLVNDASLDQAGSTTGILDWPPVSGAKTYNVYCTTFEHFFDDSNQAGTTVFLANTADSNYDAAFGSFLESNQVGLFYDCFVRGVNSDSVEGPNSIVVRANDAVGPRMVSTPVIALNDNDIDTFVDEVVVFFNEPLDETTAEIAGSYLFGVDAGGAPVTTQAVLSYCTGINLPIVGCAPGLSYATLTVTETQTAATLSDNAADLLTVSGVRDVNLKTIEADGNVYHLSTDVVD